MRKVLKVKNNRQQNNIAFKGLPGYAQCGPTSCAMLLSYFIPRYTEDKAVAELIQEIEPMYGEATLGQVILAAMPWMKGKRLTAFGDTYPHVINAIFKRHKIKRVAKLKGTSGTDQDIIKAIDSGSPCLLSTMLSSSGHYILVIGYQLNKSGQVMSWICNDPYGDAKTGYKSANGEAVEYAWGFLRDAAFKSDPNKKGYRFTYVV